MTLIDATRANGQAMSEELMVDSCIISRGGTFTWNPEEGIWEPDGPAAVIYSGKCKVLRINVQPANPQVGETEWTTLDAAVVVPLSVTGVQNGDVCTMTAVTYDPMLAGAVFPVDVVPVKSFPIDRTLISQAIQT